jgi:predicted permease
MLIRRIRYWLRARQRQAELRAEMESHLEEKILELRDAGMTEPRAKAEARRLFGSMALKQEESREIWIARQWSALAQDVSYGVRILRRSPLYATVAVLILTLGIGINLAAFHLVNAIVFHPYVLRDAGGLVRLLSVSRAGEFDSFSRAEAEFYREYATSFARFIEESDGVNASVEDEPEPIRLTFVSGSYFTDLAIVPAAGRLLVSGDAHAGAPPVAVLGFGEWQKRFGGDPGVLGRSIHVNGKPVQIVGVAPADFNGLQKGFKGITGIWLPQQLRNYVSPDADEGRERHDAHLYGRLKPGFTTAGAEAELDSLSTRLREKDASTHPSDQVLVAPLVSRTFRFEADVAVFLTLLLLILLSACANLGNLLLARGVARQQEISMRVALGASRWRVIRQLVTENVMLALLGGSTGAVAGYFAAKLFIATALVPPGLHVVMDWWMLVVSAGIALLTGLAFGLAPAFQSVKKGPRLARSRLTLVAVQVAVGCVCLILSVMLSRAGRRLEALDMRIDDRRTLAVRCEIPSANVSAIEGERIVYQLENDMAQLPGIDGVASIGPKRRFESDGQPVLWTTATPWYFRLMNLSVTRGRLFSANERTLTVVSESLARAVWPNQDPVGKPFRIRGVERIVIGVVRDSGLGFVDSGALEAYGPIEKEDLAALTLFLHTTASMRAPVGGIRTIADRRSINASLVPVKKALGIPTDSPGGGLIGALGALATTLAFVGLFGVTSFAVAQRRREIAIRIAMGASPAAIVWAALAQPLIALIVGASGGLGLAATAAMLLRSQLYGLPLLDLTSYTTALASLGLVMTIAILPSARRAIRIDPASALRAE